MLENVQFDDSDRADESQVEDRRGARFPGGRIGAGVGGLGLLGGAIYLALQLLASGGNRTAGEIGRIIQQSQRRVQVDPETPLSRLPAGPSGSCRGVDSKNDPAKFIVCVESNVQAFWHRQLSGRGSGYHPSKLVLHPWFLGVTPEMVHHRYANRRPCGLRHLRSERSIGTPVHTVGPARAPRQMYRRGSSNGVAKLLERDYGRPKWRFSTSRTVVQWIAG